MPELPEVETIRRGLGRILPDRVVKSAYQIESPKSFPNPDSEVNQFLLGAKIIAVRRRAKVLMIDLSSQYSLVVHLKMTGQLIYVGEERWGGGHPTDSFMGALPDRSTRVVIEFTDGSTLFFNDQRKFGWVRLMPTVLISELDFMKKVGPEPLEEEFKAPEFIKRIRRRQNTTIKAAILDQTTLAGVGNIYADESLWGAGIHPVTRVRDVSDAKLTKLLQEIKHVMQLAIDSGGSTYSNYVNADGERGNYLAKFARVFRREGRPCLKCGTEIQKIRVAGRGTHLCPKCQPEIKQC